MARALEDLTECSICTLIFTEPKVLPCDHNFCSACTDRIRKGNKIKCPSCNEVHDFSKVRPDFRLSKFLDALKERETDLPITVKKAYEKPFCDLCTKENASHWCEECQQWMCRGCIQTHAKIQACKTHNVVPLAIKNNAIKAKFQEEAKGINEIFMQYQYGINQLEAKITTFELSQTTALKQSDELRQKTLTQIKDHFDSIDAQIISFIQGKLAKFQQEKQKLSQELQNIQSKWQELDELIKQDSRRISVEGEAIIANAKRIVQSKPKIKVYNENFVVTVLPGNEWSPSLVAKLTLTCDKFADGECALATSQSAPPPLPELAPLQKGKFTRRKAVTLPTSSFGLRVINGQLWIGHLNSVIEIFDFDFNLLKKITVPSSVGTIFDIISLNQRELVLCGKNGLYHVSIDGTLLAKLDFGCFHSGVFKNDILYAYDKKSTEVRMYKCKPSWAITNSLQLSVDHSRFITITVLDDELFVCSNSANAIYRLEMNGKMLESYGKKGVGSAGKLNNAFLCQDDDDNALLVADMYNHQLQLLNEDRQWSIVSLVPKVENPIKAVYVEGSIFIVSNVNPGQLLKYSSS